jgi:hypothetical protein
MLGGLQSITNTTTIRNNNPVATASQSFIEVPAKVNTIVPILPDNVDAKKAKTPSPKKVAIHVEPPSGKENFTGTPRSSK